MPIQGKVAKLLLGFLRRTANDHQPVTVLENTGTGVQVIHDLSIEPAILAAALDRLEFGKKGSGGATKDSANGVQEKVDQANARLQAFSVRSIRELAESSHAR